MDSRYKILVSTLEGKYIDVFYRENYEELVEVMRSFRGHCYRVLENTPEGLVERYMHELKD